MMGRLTPRAPCSALTTISFFLFFPVLFLFFCSFFFDSRGGLCRKGGTALNVSQPRLLWSGHAPYSQCCVTRPSKGHARARAGLISVFIMTECLTQSTQSVEEKHSQEKNVSGLSRHVVRGVLFHWSLISFGGNGEWWSLELIYAWVKLSICAERDSYTNGIFLWLLGENVKSGKDSENRFVTCLLRSIFFVVWMIASKNKLNRCNAHCCLLRIHCLVSSRNAHSLLPLRDESEQKLRGRIR